MLESDFTAIPFEDLVLSGQRNLLHRDIFVTSWLLGRFCNYRCSYCWPYARSDKPDHRPFSLVVSTVDEIKRQARERGFRSFHFSFSGGEPTLHPDYLNILKYLSDDHPNCNYQSIHMTTNMSRPKSWLEQYIAVTRSFSRVSVTASFHKEFAKPEIFRDRLLFLQENKVNVTINMVMTLNNFEALLRDANYFQQAGLNVTLKPQSNQSASALIEGYSEEQLRILQQGMQQKDFANAEHGKSVVPVLQVEFEDKDGKKWYLDQAERFNSFGFNRFQGWECSAGYRSIIIREPDGSVKRSYSCHDRALGNIETGFKLFDAPKPCITPSCVSSADSKIPKRKVGIQKPLWPGDLTYQKGCKTQEEIS